MNKKIIGFFCIIIFISTFASGIDITDNKNQLLRRSNIQITNNNTEEEMILLTYDLKTGETIINNISNYYSENKDLNINTNLMENNLVPNPSFEEGDILPTGWNYEIYDNEIFTWDSKEFHRGSKSVGISNVTNHITPLSGGYWYTTSFIPVDPINITYEVSAYIISSEVTTSYYFASVGIILYDKNQEPLGHACGGGWTLSRVGCWRKVPGGTGCLYVGPDKNDTKYVRIYVIHRGVNYTFYPNLEVRFDDIYFGEKYNNPPDKPSVDGPINGEINIEYNYTLIGTDLDDDCLWHQWDWGDGNRSEWLGPFYPYPNEKISASHIWYENGDYEIKVRIKDSEYISEWSDPLTVTMPRVKIFNQTLDMLIRFVERFIFLQNFSSQF